MKFSNILKVDKQEFSLFIFSMFLVMSMVVIDNGNPVTVALMLLIGLFTKHLAIDFYFQTSEMAKNKGDLKHPLGYIHSYQHALYTFIVLSSFVILDKLGFMFVLLVSLSEGALHYAIDYWKVNSTKARGYTIDMPEFWYLLGYDQYLHALTYIGICFLVMNNLAK